MSRQLRRSVNHNRVIGTKGPPEGGPLQGSEHRAGPHLEGLHKGPQQNADGIALAQQLDEPGGPKQAQEAEVDEIVLWGRQAVLKPVEISLPPRQTSHPPLPDLLCPEGKWIQRETKQKVTALQERSSNRPPENLPKVKLVIANHFSCSKSMETLCSRLPCTRQGLRETNSRK